MKYIGLDCHKQYGHARMIDTETGEIKGKRLTNTKEEFREFIGDRALCQQTYARFQADFKESTVY